MKKTLSLISALLFVGPSLCLMAKEQDTLAKKQLRRWALSASFVVGPSVPAQDMHAAFIKEGFDGVAVFSGFSLFGSGFGAGEVKYPVSTKGGTSSGSIELSYLFSQHFRASLMAFTAEKGWSNGYRSYHELGFHYSSKSYAQVFSFQDSLFRIGVGPLLYDISTITTQSLFQYREDRTRKRHVGLLFDFGLFVPRQSRFFLELKAQYRLLPSLKIGPCDLGTFQGDDIFFPETRVSPNRWQLGLGLGVRI